MRCQSRHTVILLLNGALHELVYIADIVSPFCFYHRPEVEAGSSMVFHEAREALPVRLYWPRVRSNSVSEQRTADVVIVNVSACQKVHAPARQLLLAVLGRPQ